MKFILLFVLACCPIWCDIKITFIQYGMKFITVAYFPYMYTIYPNTKAQNIISENK